MTTPLRLRLASLKDGEPWIIEQQYFIILYNYLQPESQVSAAEAAARINELTPMNREANGEEAEEPESWCLEFWGAINEFATTRIWTDLPYLMEVWYEYAVTPERKDENFEFERWINWQAFSARVLQADLADWFRLTTRCFRHAFEEEPFQSDEFSECRIRGAAQWVEYSGERLFCSLDNLPDFTDLNPGKLYTGKGGLSRERWDFWEASFRALAENENSSEEVSLICDKAAQKMAAIAAVSAASDEQSQNPAISTEQSDHEMARTKECH
ncbi:hypothetical protein PENCOP_c005G01046 [Penicillium coprophilum]|uniref:Uncharacterized protein n=1 Tax=Penicillium coprophilum TaxID=36646 RepID=A0A1V6USM0_9EURO|nr:hypothetical protein PENCOP_c005G01046 [Penicillium coprophilum]